MIGIITITALMEEVETHTETRLKAQTPHEWTLLQFGGVLFGLFCQSESFKFWSKLLFHICKGLGFFFKSGFACENSDSYI